MNDIEHDLPYTSETDEAMKLLKFNGTESLEVAADHYRDMVLLRRKIDSTLLSPKEAQKLLKEEQKREKDNQKAEAALEKMRISDARNVERFEWDMSINQQIETMRKAGAIDIFEDVRQKLKKSGEWDASVRLFKPQYGSLTKYATIGLTWDNRLTHDTVTPHWNDSPPKKIYKRVFGTWYFNYKGIFLMAENGKSPALIMRGGLYGYMGHRIKPEPLAVYKAFLNNIESLQDNSNAQALYGLNPQAPSLIGIIHGITHPHFRDGLH